VPKAKEQWLEAEINSAAVRNSLRCSGLLLRGTLSPSFTLCQRSNAPLDSHFLPPSAFLINKIKKPLPVSPAGDNCYCSTDESLSV